MAQTVNAPKKATIRGYDHELAYIMPHEEMILKFFGGGTHADGSQKYGPDGIKSFDPGDGQGEEGGNDTSGSGTGGKSGGGDTSGHGGMSVDEGVAASVTDMNDPFGFGGFFGGLGFDSRAAAMGSFGSVFGGMATAGDMVGAIAAEAGISVDEPTGVRGGDPAAFGGGDQGNDVGGSYEALMAAIGADPGLQSLIAPGDYTKRISGAENIVTRQRLYEIYKSIEANSGDDRYNMSSADQRMLQDTLGQYSNDHQSVGWGNNRTADLNAIRNVLQSDQFQATVTDRDFGKLKGFNKTQAEKYRDFEEDFGNGEFAKYIGENGLADQVNADMDVFFGENDELAKALAQQFDYEGSWGGGRFWADVDARGIDHGTVNSFIDAFNGATPVTPVTPFTTTGGVPDIGINTGGGTNTGGGPATDWGMSSNGWNIFEGINIPQITMPDFDMSFLNEPATVALPDQVAGAVGDELDQDDARNDILAHIRNLPRRSTGGNQTLSYDIGGSGINFL